MIAYSCMPGANAQLSPGELVGEHAHLEGISNCTKCHVLGKKVSNEKCLDCHDAIRERVNAGTGYHASREVRGKDCFACHSDHHGRDFEIIRFDIDRFDHDLTGYALTGAHRTLDCAQCHKQEFITDRDLLDRPGTYLGLSTACISCHDDYHQGTLADDCRSCHTTGAFRPAERFSHADTRFPLRGQHADVECIECHAMTKRNGIDFQEFAGIGFNQCSSCHADPHRGRFGADCKRCHTEESFFALRGQPDFDHGTTGFPLLGQHSRIGCAACHKIQRAASDVFRDYASVNTENCTACHDDVHEGNFGSDCRQCHSEESFFTIVGGLESVDHDRTDFPLRGKHQAVDCRQCHTSDLTDPLAYSRCTDCHDDYHEGQFMLSDNTTQDCAECHSVEGFEGSSYTIAQHNASAFPLEGAHLATPCFACHFVEDQWHFRDIGTACVDCHDNVHAGLLDERYYPGHACTNCHSANSWREVSFDHSLTGFSLAGAHEKLTCTACHLDEGERGMEGQSFAGLSTECAACHDNIHRSQFAVEGKTECRRCHGFEQWKPSTFDHDSARFVLEGAHLTVDCAACHIDVEVTGESYVLYRLEKLDCADCHR